MKTTFIISSILVNFLLTTFAVTCEFKDKNGNHYDLSALANVNKSEMIHRRGFDYYVTPCARTPKNDETNCTEVMRERYNETAPNDSPEISTYNGTDYCVGKHGDLKTQKFTYDYNANILVLAYTDGSVCGRYSKNHTAVKSEFKIFF